MPGVSCGMGGAGLISRPAVRDGRRGLQVSGGGSGCPRWPCGPCPTAPCAARPSRRTPGDVGADGAVGDGGEVAVPGEVGLQAGGAVGAGRLLDARVEVDGPQVDRGPLVASGGLTREGAVRGYLPGEFGQPVDGPVPEDRAQGFVAPLLRPTHRAPPSRVTAGSPYASQQKEATTSAAKRSRSTSVRRSGA